MIITNEFLVGVDKNDNNDKNICCFCRGCNKIPQATLGNKT